MDELYNHFSDEKLAELFRQTGKHDVFDEIVKRNQNDPIKKVCKFFFSREQDVEDVSQIVLEIVFKALQTVTIKRKVKSYIAQITRHECFRWIQGERGRPDSTGVIPDDVPPDKMPMDFSNVFEGLQHENPRLFRCLMKLKVEQRIVIWLHKVEEMNYFEIAKTFGIHWGDVRSRIWNGMRNLKICMGGKRND